MCDLISLRPLIHHNMYCVARHATTLRMAKIAGGQIHEALP